MDHFAQYDFSLVREKSFSPYRDTLVPTAFTSLTRVRITVDSDLGTVGTFELRAALASLSQLRRLVFLEIIYHTGEGQAWALGPPDHIVPLETVRYLSLSHDICTHSSF